MSVRRCSRQAEHRTTVHSAVASTSGTVRGGGTQCGPSVGHVAGRDSAVCARRTSPAKPGMRVAGIH
eukprot:3443995-Lingulodinium_polyedra.AAC.1